MTEEQPYPDMTDQDILETILHYALTVMETNKQMGDDLWNIHKYLERRLSERGDEIQSSGEEVEENPPGDNQAKVINVFHNVDNVTINNYEHGSP
jgi:hypothetical protein